MFINTLPMPIALRIWDAILCLGSHVLLQVVHPSTATSTTSPHSYLVHSHHPLQQDHSVAGGDRVPVTEPSNHHAEAQP